MKTASVIGIGRLGLCWALNLEKNGYDVVGVDVCDDYIKSINDKTFTSKEPLVDEYLQKSSNFVATTRLDLAINHSDMIYIVVATNTLKDGHYDHSIIDSIVDELVTFGKEYMENNHDSKNHRV